MPTKYVSAANPSSVTIFSQATLFYNSMSHHEKEHIIAAYSFELGKVEREFIRARQVNEILANIDLELAKLLRRTWACQRQTGSAVPARETSLKESPA